MVWALAKVKKRNHGSNTTAQAEADDRDELPWKTAEIPWRSFLLSPPRDCHRHPPTYNVALKHSPAKIVDKERVAGSSLFQPSSEVAKQSRERGAVA